MRKAELGEYPLVARARFTITRPPEVSWWQIRSNALPIIFALDIMLYYASLFPKNNSKMSRQDFVLPASVSGSVDLPERLE